MQVLGSGGPELEDQRASSSYLVWQDARARVLIDSGGGSALRFGQSAARVAQLDVIVFTHLHIDHGTDFPALMTYFASAPRVIR
jgi:ribonuclease BN (tRNA processing enzyme)